MLLFSGIFDEELQVISFYGEIKGGMKYLLIENQYILKLLMSKSYFQSNIST